MKKTWILILLVIALAAIPLFLSRGAEFGGSVDQAEVAITQIQTNYLPWATLSGSLSVERLKAYG